MAQASLLQVKAFFEETDAKKFTEEWKKLDESEKAYFKAAAGEAMGLTYPA